MESLAVSPSAAGSGQRDFLISAGQPAVTALLNQITCQYTDVNLKLSSVLMKLPRDKVCNVNGVQTAHPGSGGRDLLDI
jgi:hypothetical protein